MTLKQTWPQRSPGRLPPYRDLTPCGWCYRPDHPAGNTANKGVPLILCLCLCLRFGLEFILEFSFLLELLLEFSFG